MLELKNVKKFRRGYSKYHHGQLFLNNELIGTWFENDWKNKQFQNDSLTFLNKTTQKKFYDLFHFEVITKSLSIDYIMTDLLKQYKDDIPLVKQEDIFGDQMTREYAAEKRSIFEFVDRFCEGPGSSGHEDRLPEARRSR